MKTINTIKVFVVGLVLALSSFALASSSGVFGSPQGLMTIQGTMLCAGCDLSIARQMHPDTMNMVEVHSSTGQTVMALEYVSENYYLRSVVHPGAMYLRGSPEMIGALVSTRNIDRSFEMVGILRSTRTFDVFQLKYLAPEVHPVLPPEQVNPGQQMDPGQQVNPGQQVHPRQHGSHMQQVPVQEQQPVVSQCVDQGGCLR